MGEHENIRCRVLERLATHCFDNITKGRLRPPFIITVALLWIKDTIYPI